MTDSLTPEQRHLCMSHIHSSSTKPELKVRRWLWHHGYRYRLNVKGVPGKPDIVMRSYRTAIFVNGCFWHGHKVVFPKNESAEMRIENSECCKIPKSNRNFWVTKIRRNQERDKKISQLLQENGWHTIIVWECELKPAVFEETMNNLVNTMQDMELERKYSFTEYPIETSIAAEGESPVYGNGKVSQENNLRKKCDTPDFLK